MHISSLKATNIELTDAIKTYVEVKLQPIAKLVSDLPEAALSVEVGKTTNHHNKGFIFRTELNLRLGKETLRSEEDREDLYESIDVAVDDLKRQVKDRKEKMVDAHRQVRPGKE